MFRWRHMHSLEHGECSHSGYTGHLFCFKLTWRVSSDITIGSQNRSFKEFIYIFIIILHITCINILTMTTFIVLDLLHQIYEVHLQWNITEQKYLKLLQIYCIGGTLRSKFDKNWSEFKNYILVRLKLNIWCMHQFLCISYLIYARFILEK